ncbi:hypothetical protein NU08_3557 [Flavobacterium anhuiense]|uniref:Uncharacterized protein n=1 Tax=Flavobacterium anhuiense TaxID=459526 RepID=A0A444VVQ8_9FLAO|nr:hypothetical protein NU08_3557 [Flavobacterium anhuiense]
MWPNFSFCISKLINQALVWGLFIKSIFLVKCNSPRPISRQEQYGQ